MGRSSATGDASDFDVTEVKTASLRFGAGDAPVYFGPVLGSDLDGDTNPDAVYGFDTFDSAIACDDTEVTLTGEMLDGDQFSATDTIETINCDAGGCHP